MILTSPWPAAAFPDPDAPRPHEQSRWRSIVGTVVAFAILLAAVVVIVLLNAPFSSAAGGCGGG
jgi:hypothetical protein